jgi:hypothetical protein
MHLRTALALTAAMALSACGTAGMNFSAALEKPVESAGKAKAIAQLAERDFLRARYLGMVSGTAPAAGAFDAVDPVCVPARGPANATDGLGVFPAVLETVMEVGEKPADTSFAAYSKAFRNNADNIAAASEDPAVREAREQKKIADERLRLQRRCRDLYAADQAAPMSLHSHAQPGMAAGPLALFVGGVSLLKEIMGIAERLQREQAVRTTIKASIPALDKAVAALGGPANAAYGPRVDYPPTAAQFAENGTVLGATINIRRWMLAKQIEAIAGGLASCRASEVALRACLADSGKRRDADDAVEFSMQYRALAAVDTTKVLDGLRKGVDDARKSNALSFSDAIEGLVDLSDTLDGLSKSYGDFQQAGGQP